MREIKFRTWNPETKKFIYSDKRDLETQLFRLTDFFKELCKLNYDFYLQKYTGLKDKDGCEIYEGDIIQRLPKNSYPFPWIVEFSMNCGWDLCSTAEYEIIGNVYENPRIVKNLNKNKI